MHNPCIGKFVGTLVLVLLGNGAVANVSIHKSKAEGSGWIVITTSFGFAVMTGVFTAIDCGSADAHINPAVTLGFAISSGDFSFFPHWAVTPHNNLKLACFSAGPAIRSAVANILAELIGTFVLVLGIAAIFSKHVSASGPAAGLGPYLVGTIVWAVGLSLGGPTGFAINPGPRSRPENCPRDCPAWCQRQLGLGLCTDSSVWRIGRRRACGSLLGC